MADALSMLPGMTPQVPSGPPTQEEESTFLPSIMGGAAYLGGVLNKPGAAVRGSLNWLTGGDAGGGLLNLIPFSDTAGITDPAKQISGSDLLENWGILPKKEHEGFDFGSWYDYLHGAADLGMNIATDPLMWGGIGTLTGLGREAEQAAMKAGKEALASQAGKVGTGFERFATKTPKNLAEQFANKERALLNIHYPFSRDPFLSLGTGEGIGNAISKIAYGGKWAAAPLNAFRGLFSASAAGEEMAMDPAKQLANDVAYSKLKDITAQLSNIDKVATKEHAGLFSEYQKIAAHFQENDDVSSFNKIMQLADQHLNGTLQPDMIRQELEKQFPDAAFQANKIGNQVFGGPQSIVQKAEATAALSNRMYDFLENMHTAIDNHRTILNKMGLAWPDHVDAEVSHGIGQQSRVAAMNKAFWNRWNGKIGPGGGEGAGMLPNKPRVDVMRNLPGGPYFAGDIPKSKVFGGYEIGADGKYAYAGVPEHIRRFEEDLGPDVVKSIKQKAVTEPGTPAAFDAERSRLMGIARNQLEIDARKELYKPDSWHLSDRPQGDPILGETKALEKYEAYGKELAAKSEKELAESAAKVEKVAGPAARNDEQYLNDLKEAWLKREVEKNLHVSWFSGQPGVQTPEDAIKAGRAYDAAVAAAKGDPAKMPPKLNPRTLPPWGDETEFRKVTYDGQRADWIDGHDEERTYLSKDEKTGKTSSEKKIIHTDPTRAGELRDYVDSESPVAWAKRVQERILNQPNISQKFKDEASEYLAKMNGGSWRMGLYDANRVSVAYDYLKQATRQLATLMSRDTFLASKGLVGAAETFENGSVPLVEAWQKSGFTNHGLWNWVLENENYKQQVQKALATLTEQDVQAMRNLGTAVSENTARMNAAANVVAKGLYTDSRTAGALRAFQTIASPDKSGPLAKGIDKLNSLFKQVAYTPWISSHARDLGSHTFNVIADERVNPIKYLNNMWHALRFAAKGGFENPEGLEGAEAFTDFAKQGNLTGGEAYEILGKKSLPWERPPGGGFLHAMSGASPEGQEPKNIFSKIAGYPFRMGQNLQQLQTWINRSAYYKSLFDLGYAPGQAAELVKRASFAYDELSKFDRDVMKRIIPFWCVPDYSEILTQRGWQTCDTLEVGDIAATYNLEKDCLEWQPVEEKRIFDADCEIVVFESDQVKFEFTTEHRWPVMNRAQTVKRPYGTYSYPERRTMATLSQLTSQCSFIQSPESHATDSILTPDQARLIGWLLTDGAYRWRPQWHKSKGIKKKKTGRPKRGTSKTTWPPPPNTYLEGVLYQHPKKFLEECKRVAGGKVGSKPNPTSGAYRIQVLPERLAPLREHLRHSKSDPYWVSVVTKLSRDAAEAMYDAMYKGGGVTAKNRHQDHFTCLAHKNGVGEAFQILAMMIGRNARPNYKGYYVSNHKYIQLSAGKMTMRQYKGRVWCPRTENGTWIMRQGGMIVATGNTFMRKNLPYQLTNMFSEPGGVTAQALKATRSMSTASGGGTYTPAFLAENQTYAVAGEDPTKQTFLRSSVLPFGDLNDVVLRSGVPDIGRSIEKFFSRATPALTAPVELYAGKQLQTGRNISDLESPTRGLGNWIDRLQGEPEAAMASPRTDRAIHYLAGRPVGELGNFMDTRKTWIESLIGQTGMARAATYDANAWRTRDVREGMSRDLQANPRVGTWKSFYIPADQAKLMTPEEKAKAEFEVRRREKLTRVLAENRKQAQPAGSQ